MSCTHGCTAAVMLGYLAKFSAVRLHHIQSRQKSETISVWTSMIQMLDQDCLDC